MELTYDSEQKLKDFKVLESIVKGETEITSLDEELKQRLIILCKERTKQVKKKIEIVKRKSDKLKKGW